MHFVGICHNDGSCEAPMVAVAAVGETDAEITWFGGTGTEWMVEYRPMGGEQWILADTTDGSPYELTGLTPGTNYEVRVKTDCGINGMTVTIQNIFYATRLAVQCS